LRARPARVSAGDLVAAAVGELALASASSLRLLELFLGLGGGGQAMELELASVAEQLINC